MFGVAVNGFVLKAERLVQCLTRNSEPQLYAERGVSAMFSRGVHVTSALRSVVALVHLFVLLGATFPKKYFQKNILQLSWGGLKCLLYFS